VYLIIFYKLKSIKNVGRKTRNVVTRYRQRQGKKSKMDLTETGSDNASWTELTMVELYGDGDKILGTEFPEYLNSHLSLYRRGTCDRESD
jgi:hypothetical protein